MTTTTDTAIRTLETNAAQAGDHAMVLICQIALGEVELDADTTIASLPIAAFIDAAGQRPGRRAVGHAGRGPRGGRAGAGGPGGAGGTRAKKNAPPRPGRKPLPAGEARTVTRAFKFTPAEDARNLIEAGRHGLTLTEWVRGALELAIARGGTR